MQVLELKLSILIQGPRQERRNPALDVLTGRVPDERLITLQAGLTTSRSLLETRVAGQAPTTIDVSAATLAPEPTVVEVPVAHAPTTMVLPVAAIRMAAVARNPQPAPSPWLQSQSAAAGQTRLRLVSPAPSQLERVPWLGWLLGWLMAEFRAYTWRARNPPVHPAS